MAWKLGIIFEYELKAEQEAEVDVAPVRERPEFFLGGGSRRLQTAREKFEEKIIV